MRITTKLFDSSDLEAKKKSLHTTQVYKQIAELYEKFALEFGGKRIWFLTNRMKDDTLRKRYEQCEKLVDIGLTLNVPFATYMKVQFEILTPFFKRTTMQNPYPKFCHLISPKAVERFESHISKLKERYTGTHWMDQYTKGSFVDIRKSILASAHRFYDRLKQIREITGKPLTIILVLKEFEMQARAGTLSNVYIWSSPLQCERKFITALREKTNEKMTDSQKFLARRIRKLFITEFKDKDLLKYV